MATPVADEWVTIAEDEWVDEPAAAPVPKLGSLERERQFLEASKTKGLGDLVASVPKMAGIIGSGMVLGGAGRLLTKVPWKPLASAGMALATSGPRMRAAKKAWDTASKATPNAAPVPAAAPPPVIPDEAVPLGPMPKPKLSASQVKQALRDHYGAEKGGIKLWGKAQPDLSAAERTAGMRAGTTGGNLPQAAQRAIDKKLAESSAEEAFAYAGKARNDQAKSYFGEQLKAALAARMRK